MALDTSSERGGLLERVTRTEPLIADGMSGSSLERAWLADGSTVIIKHVDPRFDWITQATGDDGRVAGLWEAGVFDRVPPSIEHAMLDVRRTPDGAIVVMKDMSTSLFDGEPGLRAAHTRVLRAATDLHNAFDEPPPAPLCTLRDLFALLSPQSAARFAAEHAVPRQAVEGWSRFHQIVPRDVSEAIAAVHENPDRLADALLSRRCTLVHGDLKMANLGVTVDRVVIVDWGTTTLWAPPAIDYAWYMAVNSAAVGLPPDRLLDDIRGTDAGADEPALRLALVGALTELGWAKALGATDNDEQIRRRERDGLAWWTAQVRNALPLLG
jgi:hypothetical protein